jgi:transcriptional regulator with XRE-family HTH domain
VYLYPMRLSASKVEALYRLIGRRISYLRSSRQPTPWSQAKLAAEVGLARGSIANIEVGRQRPPLDTLWAIAKALEVEPRLLFPSDGELEERRDHSEPVLSAVLTARAEKFVERLDDETKVRRWLSSTLSELETPDRRPAQRDG